MDDAGHEIEMVIHFVYHCDEGDDDKPEHDYECRHQGRKHEWVEGGVEIVFLPEFGNEILYGSIDGSHNGD